MDIEQQLQEIIDDAPNYGVPQEVVSKAIAPVLRSCAAQLQHLEYYVLQNLDSDWVLTTLANPKLQQEKRVIYAFVSVQDAAVFQKRQNPDLIAMPISVVQLLFRLFSLQQVDSIIFLDNSLDLEQGVEVRRDLLAEAITNQIKQLKQPPSNFA